MKKNRSTLIMFCVIVIFINHVTLSRADSKQSIKLYGKIGKPIVNLETDDKLECKVNEDKFPIEYNFSINNYENDEINQIDFYYTIEVVSSVDNFPIQYRLYDSDINKELKMIKGKSEELKIKKNEKEKRNFKLVLNWNELEGDLADEVKINLKINVVQDKKDEARNDK